jgi:hypothetical protein
MSREELARHIEIADRVLAEETRYGSPFYWRDYAWLKNERARLVREHAAFQQQED